MTHARLALRLLDDRLAVCRLAPDAPFPAWLLHESATLWSVTRTPDELSIVCPEDDVPPAVSRVERGFRAFAVAGPLPFDAVGILASLSAPLAAAGIPILALSTFDTDLVLVREDRIDEARRALAPAFDLTP